MYECNYSAVRVLKRTSTIVPLNNTSMIIVGINGEMNAAHTQEAQVKRGEKKMHHKRFKGILSIKA